MIDAAVSPRLAPPASAHDFVSFHARHKLLLMAHAPAAVSALGRLVAGAGGKDLGRIWSEYETLFRATLQRPVSRGGHVNVLMHAAGYFRGVLDDERRRELAGTIEAFGNGAAELDEPVRLIRSYAEQYGITYLLDQVYLRTSPS